MPSTLPARRTVPATEALRPVRVCLPLDKRSRAWARSSDMRLRFGPVLYIGQCDASAWRFFVGVLVEGGMAAEGAPLRLTSEDRGVEIGAPSVAADFGELAGSVYWRWPVSVQREERERFIGYRLEASRPEHADPALPVEVRNVAIPALR